MNPFERAIRAVDHTQRRFTPTAFVFGVVKKQGDDNGGVLTSNLAFAAFRSLFPLLLILVTILGLLSAVNAQFRTDVLNAVAAQVPLLGHTLTSNVHQLKRASIIGLIIGIVGLVWGSAGLAQAACSPWSRSGTCPGQAAPVTCRDSAGPACSCSCWAAG